MKDFVTNERPLIGFGYFSKKGSEKTKPSSKSTRGKGLLSVRIHPKSPLQIEDIEHTREKIQEVLKISL